MVAYRCDYFYRDRYICIHTLRISASEILRKSDTFSTLQVSRESDHGPRNGIITFREERNEAYLNELAGLIEDVSDAAVNVSEKNVVLSQEATEQLGVVR